MSLSNGLAQAIQVLEEGVQSVPLGEIPALTGDLERLKVLAFARLMQKPEPDHGHLLTPAQVAAQLNVAESFVYEAARSKQLKAVRVGKKYVRFTEAAVQAFQAKQGG
jgi:excisionase family DNA binding protein